MKLLPQFAESLIEKDLSFVFLTPPAPKPEDTLNYRIGFDPVSPKTYDSNSFGIFYTDELGAWQQLVDKDFYDQAMELSKYYGSHIMTEEELKELGKRPDMTPPPVIAILEKCSRILWERELDKETPFLKAARLVGTQLAGDKRTIFDRLKDVR
jgi:hypothetical protein